MSMEKNIGDQFGTLVGIIARLRGKNGCPWDREQDERTITGYFLEEVYEAVDAAAGRNPQALAEELGDVLMEIVFLSRIFEEKGRFSIADVLDGINQKMIRRHPHVFGAKKIRSARRVLDEWIRQKKTEKKRGSHFEGISRQAPSLLAAYQVGQRVSHFGFDWPGPAEALQKVKEEIGELEHALKSRRRKHAQEEIGDVFFALANVARLLSLNPELALRQANDKFMKRFAKLEQTLQAQGKELGRASLDEMDKIWDEIKLKSKGTV
jgi:tetrapyrrole methylase family protein/MazG family protein